MGHPDKVADQIPTAILDAILAQGSSRAWLRDPGHHGQVVLAGEVTTEALFDAAQIARDTIKEIAYTHPISLRLPLLRVLSAIHSQSPDIARASIRPRTMKRTRRGRSGAECSATVRPRPKS